MPGQRSAMQEWNAVINVHERGFRQAFAVLGEFGLVRKTEFFNVLLLHADDIPAMLEELRKRLAADPHALAFLSRLIPVTSTFTFQSPEEFETKASAAVLQWVPDLTGKGFYVRMRRRGFKGRLSSLDEERFLDDVLLQALEKAGTPGHISFDQPDCIIAVETIAQWAGLALWHREDLQRYPFMGLE